VAGELEALSALARQAFEQPGDGFPELVERDVPLLVAEEVRHPLMRSDRCVPNTVSLEAPLRLLLVSGSNMSGKSTLLRTLGLNVVLALMGAPVRARRFVLSPLQVAATLRVQDSLQEGASRFFAEIARIKVVADCAAERPTLFLLDEILSGTNSHDRRIGTEAVVRSLLGRNALGLVTTHDLALTEIVATLGDRAANVHFEDQMTGATLAFDYTMRPGVVQKSNAIALMRAVGLEV
jgi:DNA mismatch repair ATPase MutS